MKLTVLSGIPPHVEIARRRFIQAECNVIPLRKSPQNERCACWQNRTTWAVRDDRNSMPAST